MSPQAADQYIREHENIVQGMIFKVLPRPKEFASRYGIGFDDLVQIARLALWEALRTYDADRGDMTLESFACYVIRNRLESYIDKLKRYARRNGNYPGSLNEKLESGDEVGELHPSPINVERAALRSVILDEAVRPFTQRQREIFSLRLKGFSYQEIADLLGLKSCGDLHTQLERAVKKIDPSFTLKRDVRRGNVGETFVRMYNEGRSKEEIIEALQIKAVTFKAYKSQFKEQLIG